jgi:hypothetical protein
LKWVSQDLGKGFSMLFWIWSFKDLDQVWFFRTMVLDSVLQDDGFGFFGFGWWFFRIKDQVVGFSGFGFWLIKDSDAIFQWFGSCVFQDSDWFPG